MKKVTEKQKEQAIIGLIKDTLIWSRVSEKLHAIGNVLDPEKNMSEKFVPEYEYGGIFNIFSIMGIGDEPNLASNLDNVFCAHIESNVEVMAAAEEIYIDWLREIKNFYTQEKHAEAL